MKTIPRHLLCLTLFALIDLLAPQARAQITCPPSGHPFARGYCSLERGRHGQWIRSKAELKPDGTLTMGLGLETDSTFFGIAGWTQVTLKDKKGGVVAQYKMDKCSIPGKKPGKARIVDFSGTLKIPKEITAKVTSLQTNPHVADDNAPQPLGLKNWKVSVTITKM